MNTGLSIIMPCLNEEATIESCVRKALGFLDGSGVQGEVIVADNGSTDASAAIARKAGARVVNVEGKGYGSAVRGGIAAAKYEYVIMGDADDSYDFSELDGFVAKLKEGYDLVVGNRFQGGIQPGAMPFSHRYIGNPVLSGIGRLLFGVPVRDFHCGLRAFRRSSMEKLDLCAEGMEFASEMIVKAALAGLNMTEVPCKLYPDGRGRAPHLRSIPDGLSHLRLMWRYRPGKAGRTRAAETLRSAAVCLGAFAGTLGFLWLCLTLVCCIPNEGIREHLKESALFYRDKDAYAFDESGKYSAIQDNYADAILLGVIWNMGIGNPLTSVLDTKYYDGEDYGESIGLYLSLAGAEPNVDYSRYWHGSAVLIRPLLLVTDIEGIRRILFGMILILTIVVSGVLIARKVPSAAIALVISFMGVQIWNVRLSVEYMNAFLVALVMCLLFVALEKKGDGVLAALSVAGGATIAFVDFLTTETVTILLPLILVFWVRAEQGRLGERKQNVLLSAKCLALWGISYLAAFVAKWSAVSWVTGENKFGLAISSAGQRVMADESAEQVTALQQFLYAVPANLSTMFGGRERIDSARLLGGLLLVFAVAGSIYYLFRRKRDNREITLLLLGLGILPYVRFLALSDHSYMHEFFTYRAQCASILALCGILRFHTELPWLIRRGDAFQTGKTGRNGAAKKGGGKYKNRHGSRG